MSYGQPVVPAAAPSPVAKSGRPAGSGAWETEALVSVRLNDPKTGSGSNAETAIHGKFISLFRTISFHHDFALCIYRAVDLY